MSREENTPIDSPDDVEKHAIPERIEITSDSTKVMEPVPPTIRGQLAELVRDLRRERTPP